MVLGYLLLASIPRDEMEWYLVWHEILHESMYALWSTLYCDMQEYAVSPTLR